MSSERPLPEVAWFGALCDDDYEQLGVPDPALRSSWDHCRDIATAADRNGFDAILMPSGYALGIDAVAFTAAVAPMLEQIRPLVAVRVGEVWVPQLAAPVASEVMAFVELVRVLRERCPWDAEQTHESLTRFMLEEAYEAVEAIATGDVDAIEGELGDVLFQVVLHSAIAEESGDFTLADVARGIREKLIRRHRHVFGDVVAETPAEVEAMWAAVKAEEKGDTGEDPFANIDDAQPALSHAAQIGRRAVAVDFDWPDVSGPMAKLVEEIGELSEALRDHGDGSREVLEEVGDLLFCAVHVARHAGVPDPETALRAASAKFLRRYAVMRKLASDRGIPVSEELWAEAKRAERD